LSKFIEEHPSAVHPSAVSYVYFAGLGRQDAEDISNSNKVHKLMSDDGINEADYDLLYCKYEFKTEQPYENDEDYISHLLNHDKGKFHEDLADCARKQALDLEKALTIKYMETGKVSNKVIGGGGRAPDLRVSTPQCRLSRLS
jgi:hypothetical protein